MQLHLQAFGDNEGPEIATLVRDLFNDQSAYPLHSFVTTDHEKIVGHILFTRVELEGAPGALSVQILAPLAVLPGCHGSGIGNRLMDYGLSELKKNGVELVFVLGHPEYYPRAGFTPAIPLGLTAPYPIPEENADAWMVQELSEGLLGNVKGRVRCSDVLNEPQYWRE